MAALLPFRRLSLSAMAVVVVPVVFNIKKKNACSNLQQPLVLSSLRDIVLRPPCPPLLVVRSSGEGGGVAFFPPGSSSSVKEEIYSRTITQWAGEGERRTAAGKGVRKSFLRIYVFLECSSGTMALAFIAQSSSFCCLAADEEVTWEHKLPRVHRTATTTQSVEGVLDSEKKNKQVVWA